MEQDGRLLRHGSRLVGPVLQDGGDGFVGAGVEQEGARAGGVDTFRPVALDEAENPDGRADVTSGVNFTENQRFENRCFLAIVAPRLHAGALSPDRGRGEIPATVALGGRVWSGRNPL